MADALNVKNRGIPLKIDGATRFIRGATKYTTSSDVIKMVLKKTGIGKEYRHLFAIYEISKEGEMLVPGKTRILKHIESWNFEPNKLVLRKTDPLGHVPVSSTTSKTLFKKKTYEKPNLQADVIKPEEKYTDIVKVTKFILKQKDKMTRQNEQLKDKKQTTTASSSTTSCMSTSESDSSLEDFIANVDHTKMASFIEFFNAITIHESGKQSQHGDQRCQSTSSDESIYDQPSKPCSRCSRKTSRKSNSHFKRFHKHRKACSKCQSHSDLLPNNMHSIQTVDYGLVDDYALYDSLNQSGERLSHEENTPSKYHSRKSGSKFQMAKYVLPLSRRTSSMRTNLFSKTTRRSEASSDDDSVLHSYKSINPDNFDNANKCRELWDANMEEQHDSGHDDIMYSDPEKDHLYSSIISSPSNSYNKLVDYSITDDEASEDDDSINFLGQDKQVCIDNISRVMEPTEGAFADDETSETSFGSSIMSANENDKNERCYNNKVFCKNSDDKFGDNTEHSNVDICEPNGNSIDNNVHNISNISEYIKSIFGKNFVPNEDDEMDSFMKSKVFSEDYSDDGLSSLEGSAECDNPFVIKIAHVY